MNYTYILGIFLALIATTFFNVVPILQKEVVDKMDDISSKNFLKSLKIMLTDWKWLLGAFFGIAGGIPYFIALQIAGVIVVQPLMNFGFIALVFFARKYLNEKLDFKAYLSIALMAIMPVFITLGNVSDPSAIFNVSDLILFSIIALICIVFFSLLGLKIKILWAVAAGISYAFGAIFMQAFTISLDLGTSGLSISYILNQVLSFWHYGVLSLAGNLLGVAFFQIGLQKNSASKFNPINQTINNTVSMIGGMLIFLQIPASPISYALGFIIGAIGVVFLARYDLDPNSEESDYEISKNNEDNLQSESDLKENIVSTSDSIKNMEN